MLWSSVSNHVQRDLMQPMPQRGKLQLVDSGFSAQATPNVQATKFSYMF